MPIHKEVNRFLWIIKGRLAPDEYSEQDYLDVHDSYFMRLWGNHEQKGIGKTMSEKFKPVLISLGKGLVKAGSSEVAKYFLANGGKKVNKTIAQNMAKENPYAKNPMTVRTIRNAQNIVDMRSVDTKGKSIKQISKKMDSIRSGGGRAAGISSALGRTPKSLLKNKLMPKT